MDSSKINMLGWKPKIELKFGLIKTINEFISYIKAAA